MNLVEILIVFAVVLFSMVLHELAHGMVAYWLGDTTAKDEGRLTLNPLSHLDPTLSLILPLLSYILGGPIFGGAKPVPVDSRNLKWREWGMALVALAGPVMNLLLALASFLIGYFTGILINGDGVLYMILYELVVVNLSLCVFNLIPVPPLDGSRILYAVAPDGVRSFMLNIERYGVIIVYILVATGLVSNIISGAMMGILRGFYWLVGVVV